MREYRKSAVFPEIPDGCVCAFWQRRNEIWAAEYPAAERLGWGCPEHGFARFSDDGALSFVMVPIGVRKPVDLIPATVKDVRRRWLQASLLDGDAA